MKILKDKAEVAQVDLDSLSIETQDKQLEEFFYELVDEGLPTLKLIGDEDLIGDVEIRVPLGGDTEGLFSQVLLNYGYEVQE